MDVNSGGRESTRQASFPRVKITEKLESAKTPDGTVLTLYRHDGDYYLKADGIELMTTRRHQSEDELAIHTCTRLQSVPNARVLIGGLGFGFTLKAALRLLRDDARVVVAEIMPEVIEWYTNPAYGLAGDSATDPRVELRVVDVRNVLRDEPGGYDAILLDTDNGAESLTTAGNSRLYDDAGIHAAVAALRPNGQLAYWLADEEPRFQRALRRAGLRVETIAARRHPNSRQHHHLIIAQR